jgi:hypothetical protein
VDIRKSRSLSWFKVSILVNSLLSLVTVMSAQEQCIIWSGDGGASPAQIAVTASVENEWDFGTPCGPVTWISINAEGSQAFPPITRTPTPGYGVTFSYEHPFNLSQADIDHYAFNVYFEADDNALVLINPTPYPMPVSTCYGAFQSCINQCTTANISNDHLITGTNTLLFHLIN